jgi:hypothetical protein
MQTHTNPNIAAEVRAVEEGHLCRLDAQRHCFIVRSDSGPRTYELRPGAMGDLLTVSCTCPAGIKGRQRPAGTVGCKHAALVARRMEREGFAHFDGESWRVVPRLLSLAVA